MLGIVDRQNTVSIDQGQPVEAAAEESPEFEIVLGSRQIAGVLFVATVILGAFSAVAYLAGKSFTPKAAPQAAAGAEPVVAQISTPAAVVAQPEPILKVQSAKPEASNPEQAKPESPLFGDPQNGAMYLQLGAVEKGVAIIMAEGLRKRDFPAFVAPGPNDHIFRVLIGPLDGEGYKRTKDSVDALGLSAFARKYQQ